MADHFIYWVISKGMKVILIKDVARLGRKGEVHDVPDGHAQNFLIPRKLAVVATQDGLRRAQEEKKKHDEQHHRLRDAFGEACATLKEKTIVYHVEANEQGHLFKGINARDIVQHLNTEEHLTIDESVVVLDHPIKSVGVHTIQLSYDGLHGTCTLEVSKK